MGQALFMDRAAAARVLAHRLAALKLPRPLVIMALPRGGVPVGVVLSQQLNAPLDLLLVRKIGAPWQRELAVGAVVDGGDPVVVIDEDLASRTGADAAFIEQQKAQEWQEILRRRSVYLAGRTPLPVRGATVVVCDDGIATGITMLAALEALRRRGAARRVVAVPVAPHEAVMQLRDKAEQVICIAEPVTFRSVGEHYADFHQVSDDEVKAALRELAGPPPE